MNSRDIGRIAERKALKYLERQGLIRVARNFSAPRGEIDLIMRDGPDLVFVEVRYRTNHSYGGALASLDSKKRKRIKETARLYLAQEYGDAPIPCRFDLVLMDGKHLEWCKNVEMAEA